MGKRIRDKESAVSNEINSHHTHPGRVWGILHMIKYHHWRHVKRRVTHRRPCGGTHYPRDEIPETSNNSGVDNVAVHCKPNTTLSNVEENKLVHSTTPHSKNSIKSKIKALLHEDTYKKKGKHKRSSTCPAKPQLTRVDSVHHLEVDPLSEMLLTVENPEPVLETFQNHLAAGTLDVLSPVFSGTKKPITNNDKCVECGALFSSETMEQHDKIHHKHYNLYNSESLAEEKLMNAKIFTTDASPHLFKDFLDALDVISTNKDFLLKYINDPGSPLPFEVHNQDQSLHSKSRRAKSISLPVCGTSGSKDSEHIVDEWINTKKEIESEIQNLVDFHKPSTSSSHQGNHEVSLNSDQESVERDYTDDSSDSSHVPNNVKTKNFKDLRKKLKYIIEESKNEKHRITMDAILDKIPRGNKFSKTVKKIINNNQSKEYNAKGKDSGYYSNHNSSYSKKMRRLSSMRTSSLKESVNRYSQLYETCFHNEVVNKNEVKNLKNESLKLKTEERNSILKTPKSFQRFLSLPNLKSYFNQSEEHSGPLSPQHSVRKSDDYSNIQILSPIHSDHTNEERNSNDEQKQDVKNVLESETDVNDDEMKSEKSIEFDGLEKLRDIGYTTESSTMLVEANSSFSSDTNFLDCTFELENLHVLEELDKQFKPVQVDEDLNKMYEQQEAKVENFVKEVYEIPNMEIDSNNEAAFNYVKKVLELSGFTNNESLESWYSDNQPVDPSIYEELEGCLLLDPDCSGNCDENGQCNHLLLFDIINEGLLEIFGRSYNYYPRPLSSLSYVHPLPNGKDNVLVKVWKLISSYLNSTPHDYDETCPSLDYYVSKDLAKNDGWMNLQFDSECVGLEIDDLIFDQLLEEIIYG